MELYLLRHGIAEEGRPGQRDAERALVPEGEKKLREVLHVACEAGVSPTLILSSPFKRARQTAEIAATVLRVKEKIVESETLIPFGKPEEVWNEIRTHRKEEALLLASHEPLTGQLAGFLLHTPELKIDVKKGALIRIDVDHFGVAPPHGVLRWMITPRIAH